jgi:cyclic pyranopterin phosphate synthase
MGFTHLTDSGVRMVEISDKDVVKRYARARGAIRLKRDTIEKIKAGEVEKGNVLTTAQVAATLAVKRTPDLIPLCHPISITGVECTFDVKDEEIEAVVEVKSVGKTGVEMEALTGVSVALLTIWDMVKSNEKDQDGQYPVTRISDITVEEKRKEA